MNQDAISALIRAVPLPAILIASDERVLGVNERAVALLGPGAEGRHFITALRQPTVLDAIEGCLRDGKTRNPTFLSSDGAQDTTFAVTCTRVEDALGGGVLVCFEDMTHLEQAGQMRRDFIANVSHELRTPLTALLGFIETLQGPARGDRDASDRFLGIMHVEAQRMERLVADLLSLSRVEAQERVRPTDPVDLSKCLATVMHALRPLAHENDVTLLANLSDSAIVVPGDADQLQQVVTNLVENAVKYGGQGKDVRLTLSQIEQEPTVRGPAAIVTIEDQGPGIEAAHLPRLTERFYRVDSHRSREMGGTGLGLAIVKHIINRHRGRLRIESTVGHGSTFKVVLPMEAGPAAR